MPETLLEYIHHLQDKINQHPYSIEENFLHLPFDESIISRVKESISKSRAKPTSLKHIVAIGIGGSCWGAKAVYDALKSERSLEKPLTKMHFLDQIEPDIIEKLALKLQNCSTDQVAIINISKSGTTAETAINHKLLRESLKNKTFPELFIRGESATNNSTQKEESVLTLPDKVGGRFSVFSSVGLLPLELAGVDTKSLLEGARQATKEIFSNPQKITQRVLSIFEAYQQEKSVYNIFIFSKELISLAEWQKQLLGESLGKDEKGLLPMISQGCLLYTSPSPRDRTRSRMPSSA